MIVRIHLERRVNGRRQRTTINIIIPQRSNHAAGVPGAIFVTAAVATAARSHSLEEGLHAFHRSRSGFPIYRVLSRICSRVHLQSRLVLLLSNIRPHLIVPYFFHRIGFARLSFRGPFFQTVNLLQ